MNMKSMKLYPVLPIIHPIVKFDKRPLYYLNNLMIPHFAFHSEMLHTCHLLLLLEHTTMLLLTFLSLRHLQSCKNKTERTKWNKVDFSLIL